MTSTPITVYNTPVSPKTASITIAELISEKSAQYGVSADLITYIVTNESRLNRYAEGDTSYVCKRTGQVSPSYGLSQINIGCFHPEVTLEQAYDPEFSIDFLAKGIKEGHCIEWWSTCAAFYSNSA